MGKKEKDNTEVFLTLGDFCNILRKSKKNLIGTTLLFALSFALYVMTRPIEYEAKASFREKTSAPNSFNSSGGMGATMLVGSLLDEGKNNASLSVLKSRSLLEDLIREKKLQISIQEKGTSDSILGRLWKNSKIFIASIRESPFPAILDKQEKLQVTSLVYEEEIPSYLILKMLDENTFEVHSKEGIFKGTGSLGKRFELNTRSFFILDKKDKTLSKNDTFLIDLLPSPLLAKKLQKKILIEVDKLDKTLLRFTLHYPNRHEASDILNQFMGAYLAYLRKDSHRIAKDQLRYLEKRQEEVAYSVKNKMEEYANSTQERLSVSGFPSTSHAMEFLAESQKDAREKLQKIALDAEILKKTLKSGPPYWNRFPNHLATQNELAILNEIRSLKQQLDSLSLTFKKEPEDNSSINISQRIETLKRLKNTREETENVIAALEAETEIPPLKHLDTPPYLAAYWQKSLQEKIDALHTQEPSVTKEEEKLCRSQFLSYLTKLKHLLIVEEKTMEEGISLLKAPLAEFQGLSLEAAIAMFSSLNLNLSELETTVVQYDFLIDQVLKPDVDLSTLPTFVNDPIANSICTSSLETILAFRDQDNRSAKEQKHLDEALQLRREFLLQRFEQSKELLRLRIEILKQKLFALQDMTMGLMQQKIALLDEHLADSGQILFDRMSREKDLISLHQTKLLKEMQALPEKWVSEKLIDQQLEIHRKMVEEVSKLVETKIIQKNLDVIQSTPIDLAIPPVQPVAPKLGVWLILGAFLGGLLSLSFCLVGAIRKGILASKENLTSLGLSFAGELSSIKPHLNSLSTFDLDVLRRAILNHKNASSLLLLTHGQKELGKLFASFLARQGKKVCLLPLSFDEDTKENGLLEYLEGKQDKPKIQRGDSFDFILSGGVSRFTSELLATKTFQTFLKELTTLYDVVLCVSLSSISSGEGRQLLTLFEDAIIRINGETFDEIKEACPLFEDKRVSFLF